MYNAIVTSSAVVLDKFATSTPRAAARTEPRAPADRDVSDPSLEQKQCTESARRRRVVCGRFEMGARDTIANAIIKAATIPDADPERDHRRRVLINLFSPRSSYMLRRFWCPPQRHLKLMVLMNLTKCRFAALRPKTFRLTLDVTETLSCYSQSARTILGHM